MEHLDKKDADQPTQSDQRHCYSMMLSIGAKIEINMLGWYYIGELAGLSFTWSHTFAPG